MINLPISRKIDLEVLKNNLNLSDEWFLCACPFNPSGSISLIFSHEDNDDFFYDEDEEMTEHKYVVAVQTWEGHYTTTFSFSYDKLALVQFVLIPNGYYTVVRDRYHENFIEIYNTDRQEHTRFSIGYNVNRVSVTSTGKFAVGYYSVENTPAVIVFSSEGKILWSHQNEFAKGCLDINTDSDDNICFLCKPENKLYRILGDNFIWIEEFPMPIANCVGFTADTDTSHLECPPSCLLADNASTLCYWTNGNLYPCTIEKDGNIYSDMLSFYSYRFAIALDNSTLALGCTSNIDVSKNDNSKGIYPEEVIGFPINDNILKHLHTSDKLGLTYRNMNLPNVSFVDYGKEIDLVYAAIDEETAPTGWNCHFNSNHYNKLKVNRFSNEHSVFSILWSTISSEFHDQSPVKFITLVLKDRNFVTEKFIEHNEEYNVQIACYQASTVKYYDGKSGLLFAPESIISHEALGKGTEPFAVISGQIQEITKKFNPYTGLSFVHLTVKCLNLILDVLVQNTEEIEFLSPGSHIQGTFKLTAKVK